MSLYHLSQVLLRFVSIGYCSNIVTWSQAVLSSECALKTGFTVNANSDIWQWKISYCVKFVFEILTVFQKVLMQIVQELCKRPGLNRTGFDMPTIFVPTLSSKVIKCAVNPADCFILYYFSIAFCRKKMAFLEISPMLCEGRPGTSNIDIRPVAQVDLMLFFSQAAVWTR